MSSTKQMNNQTMAAALAADLGRVASDVADAVLTVSELSGACHEVTPFCLMRPRSFQGHLRQC